MLSLYFKTAWRNLSRNKVFSVLNIFGLATGMAVALIIGLWINYQLSYDRWLPGYQQVYQVKFNFNDNGATRTRSDVCLPLEAALRNDVPGVAYATSTFGPAANTLTVGNKNLYPIHMLGGADFLNIFHFPLLEGNASQALKDLHSIVLTQSTATALFGPTDPLGKIVRIDNYENLTVTGVMKDLPPNSTFQFDYITPLDYYPPDGWAKGAATDWNNSSFQVYVALKPNVSYEQAEERAKMLVQKYAPDLYRTYKEQVIMQPLKDWHLYTEYRDGAATGGLISYVRLFFLIGLIVLAIACINFMNLSTARSEKRAREVGVRKVIGSSRKGLILQFLAESIILACVAFGLSLLLVQIGLPAFNMLTRTGIHLPYTNGVFWLLMAGYVLVTGLLAGSRPAFYLSSFQPVKVLKGTLQTSKSAVLSRKAFVVLQFTCSIGLIIATIIIYQQIQHGMNRPVGYDPNRLVQSDAGYAYYRPLKTEVLATGLVTNMTRSTAPITGKYPMVSVQDWEGKLPNEPLSLSSVSVCDSDYFRTMGIPFTAGVNFTERPAVDSLSAILNETAVRRMRLKDPIGKTFTYSGAGYPERMHVIGVVKDALNNSPFAPAEPVFFIFHPEWTFEMTYRLAPTVNTRDALAKLKPIFERHDPMMPYVYHFVDEEYAAKFGTEMLIGKLAGIFAGLAIFISCLGLFGLAAYVAEQRRKEIGIRKVLGASILQVVLLLTQDFIVLVGISCLIASPLAFYFLQQWLQGYYYRIDIGAGVFILSGGMAIVITLLTISWQAVRAAVMNPVKSLRTE